MEHGTTILAAVRQDDDGIATRNQKSISDLIK